MADQGISAASITNTNAFDASNANQSRTSGEVNQLEQAQHIMVGTRLNKRTLVQNKDCP